ncbi:AAA family ATPase, partial [Micromonospora sp. CPCC 206061]|uniref:AAA family ATPase n=1 Tax=Micromonospora sp. CPCC 206061 TaxID=3122410 RepID=UPI002FF0D72C
GRIVDFKNTVIILTTNLGTRDITNTVPLGFQAASIDHTRRVHDELKQHFRPEFLNRIDEIIVFPRLTLTDMLSIVDMMIVRIETRLHDKGMGLELTDTAKKYLAAKGFDAALGARPLRRLVQREVEDAVAELILLGELRPGQRVLVDRDGEGLAYTVLDEERMLV